MDVINQVLQTLDPSNRRIPSLKQGATNPAGPAAFALPAVRNAMSMLGKPAYADSSLPADRRITDAISKYGDNFMGGHGGLGKGVVNRDLIGRFSRVEKPTVSAMHPDDIKEASGALERFFMNDSLGYAQGQGAKDKGLINLLAGHYIGKDFMKAKGNDTRQVAQELLNRLMLDRKGIE